MCGGLALLLVGTALGILWDTAGVTSAGIRSSLGLCPLDRGTWHLLHWGLLRWVTSDELMFLSEFPRLF